MTATTRMEGRRCGRLTVTVQADYVPDRPVHWHCVCDCGRACIVDGSYLRSGHTRSCGCLQREASRAANRGRSAAVTKACEVAAVGVAADVGARVEQHMDVPAEVAPACAEAVVLAQ